jgi:hypothetical protein
MPVAFCDCTTPDCQAEMHVGRPACSNSAETIGNGPPVGWRAGTIDDKIVAVCPLCDRLTRERLIR